MSTISKKGSGSSSRKSGKGKEKEKEPLLRKACNRCRSRKTKCDGAERTGKCTHCIRSGSDCVFGVEERGTPPTRARIEELEELCSKSEARCLKLRSKCSILEKALQKMNPAINVSQLYQDSGFDEDSDEIEGNPVQVKRDSCFDHLTKESQEEGRLGIEELFKSSITILTEGENEEAQTHFFGESALIQIVRLENSSFFTPEHHAASPNGMLPSSAWSEADPDEHLRSYSNPNQMMQYWPNAQLQAELLEAYFSTKHQFRPTVDETEIRQMLQRPEFCVERNRLALAFGIFAVATKYVALPPSERRVHPVLALGTRWMSLSRVLLLEGTRTGSLLRLQALFEETCFLCTSYNVSHLGHPAIASLAKSLMGVGAHIKADSRHLQKKPEVEEAHKRLWWSLYIIDREASAYIGRPLCIKDDEFILDYPIDASSSFVLQVDLSRIVGKVLEFFYLSRINDVRSGPKEPSREVQFLEEMDLALDDWFDSFKLDYDSQVALNGETAIYSMLKVNFYGARLLLHRPFVNGPRAISQLHPRSFQVVGQSAVETIKALKSIKEHDQVRVCGITFPCMAFNTGVILLREAWKKKLGSMEYSFDEPKFCLALLREVEHRWNMVSRLCFVLSVFLQAASRPAASTAPIESDSRSLKRGFEGWSPSSSIPIQPPTFPGTSQPYGFVNQEEPQHFEELIVPRNQPQQSQNFLSNEELANLLHQTDLSQAGNLGLRESNQEDLLRLLLSSDLTHDIAGPGYNQEGDSVQHRTQGFGGQAGWNTEYKG